jgi:hypothetical protein
MTHLALADDRPPDLARERRNPVQPNSLPNDYRFGRTPAKPARAKTGRTIRGARRLFSAMLRMIAEAKLRRIARELQLRNVRYESIGFDGDRFVIDHDRASSK